MLLVPDFQFTFIRSDVLRIKHDRIDPRLRQQPLLIPQNNRAEPRDSRPHIINHPLYMFRKRSKSTFICGRGPTILIVPLSTFNICGYSLIFVFRKKRPKGNTRGSFRVVRLPVPILGEFFSMVANLKIENIRFLYPTLFCRYHTLCSPVHHKISIQGNNSHDTHTKAISASSTSKTTFKNLYINSDYKKKERNVILQLHRLRQRYLR